MRKSGWYIRISGAIHDVGTSPKSIDFLVLVQWEFLHFRLREKKELLGDDSVGVEILVRLGMAG